MNRKLEKKETLNTRQVRTYALEIKATDDGLIEGYGSVFNVVDSYDDIIAKGAFLNSIAEHKAAGTMPAMLWQHDSDKPIGIWTEISEDGKGLKLKGQLALETALGKEAHALLKMGALNGLSIGFMSRKSMYDEMTDVRTLLEVELWEVSLVTFPANTAARITNVKNVDVNKITSIRQAEKELRDAGFSVDVAKGVIAQIKSLALKERDAQLEADRALKAANALLQSMSS